MQALFCDAFNKVAAHRHGMAFGWGGVSGLSGPLPDPYLSKYHQFQPARPDTTLST